MHPKPQTPTILDPEIVNGCECLLRIGFQVVKVFGAFWAIYKPARASTDGTIIYYIMIYHIVLYYTILHHTILYYDIFDVYCLWRKTTVVLVKVVS